MEKYCADLDEQWRHITFRYGLERPEDEVDIHVFRVIMTTSLEEVTCTRSVVPADNDQLDIQGIYIQYIHILVYCMIYLPTFAGCLW